MRTIQDIYNKYDIMQNLREHMFRVAAVGEMIVDNVDFDIDKDEIIASLLLHDIGNIIKFSLPYFPEFLEPEGLHYWKKIQKDMKEKFGIDEHNAHVLISKELGMSDRIVELVDSVGFSNMCLHAESNDWGKKLCNYADLRVGPFSTLTIDERLKDGRKRYNIKTGNERWDLVECADYLEKQIFEHCSINPEDITDEAIAPYIARYPKYLL